MISFEPKLREEVMNSLKVLGLVTILLLSACSHFRLKKIDDSTGDSVNFPIFWMGILNYAYKDFIIQNSDTSCYSIEILKGKAEYSVIFSPESDVKIVGDTISLTQGGNNLCGRGISYQFDKSGKFIRRIYHR